MSADDYLKQIDRVPGWFYPADIALFREIPRLQNEAGFRGDILEIGVYEGKSAILLRYALTPGIDNLIVCDLFGRDAESEVERAENQRTYAGLERRTFERHYLRFHEALPTIYECSSTKLDLPEKSFRFIHVDGSHQYAVAKADARLAQELLIDGGVVVFDDYRSPHTPGVAAAVWGEVVDGGLIPVCLTPNKLYAVVGKDSLGLVAKLEPWARNIGMGVAIEHVADAECVRIWPRAERAGILKRMYRRLRTV